MANKPKNIGTAAETAVLRKVIDYFPDAKRVVQHGNQDQGDIGSCGQFIFEVKGGAQCRQIADKKLAGWMDEAMVEAEHAGVRFGILVTQRAGVGGPNAHRWWAHVLTSDLAELVGGSWFPGKFSTVRLELGDLLDLLGDHGYTPATPASATLLEAAPMMFDELVTGSIHIPIAI